MEIPKRFKIFGQTIIIEIDSELSNRDDLQGRANYRNNKIILLPDGIADRTKEQVEQTYWHEVLHHILYQLGYDKLNENNVFVDRIANAIHQVITTSEYNGN